MFDIFLPKLLHYSDQFSASECASILNHLPKNMKSPGDTKDLVLPIG